MLTLELVEAGPSCCRKRIIRGELTVASSQIWDRISKGSCEKSANESSSMDVEVASVDMVREAVR